MTIQSSVMLKMIGLLGWGFDNYFRSWSILLKLREYQRPANMLQLHSPNCTCYWQALDYTVLIPANNL